MRNVDAPRAGWYPDPQSRTKLRWWDGLDWSDIWRAPPSGAELIAAEELHKFGQPQPVPSGTPPPMSGLSRQDANAIIEEVRNVARSEIDRATQEFSNRATTAVRSFTPLITEYTSQLKKWVRRAIIIAIVLLTAYFIFQVVAQASFFEWLGDRIDNIEFQSGLAGSSAPFDLRS